MVNQATQGYPGLGSACLLFCSALFFFVMVNIRSSHNNTQSKKEGVVCSPWASLTLVLLRQSKGKGLFWKSPKHFSFISLAKLDHTLISTLTKESGVVMSSLDYCRLSFRAWTGVILLQAHFNLHMKKKISSISKAGRWASTC